MYIYIYIHVCVCPNPGNGAQITGGQNLVKNRNVVNENIKIIINGRSDHLSLYYCYMIYY